MMPQARTADDVHALRMRAMVPLLLAAALTAQVEGRTLRGRAVDEHGKPLANVAVCGFRSFTPFVTSDLTPLTRTDADGRFAVTGTAAAPIDELLLTADGRVHVCAGAHPDLQPIVLPRARILAGRVRDADGRPVEGARVEASDWLATAAFLGGGSRDGFPRPLTAVRTDAGGRFVLRGTCDTAMLVTIHGDGIDPLCLGPVDAADPLDVSIRRFLPVQVAVVDADGQPVADTPLVWSIPRTLRAPTGLWTTRTDAHGLGCAPAAGATGISCHLDRDGHAFGAGQALAPADRQVTLQLREGRTQVPAATDEAVAVRVVDTLDQPVPRFRAAAVALSKLQGATAKADSYWGLFDAIAVDGRDGRAAVPVRGQDRARFAVLVAAAGHAPSATVQDPDDELRVVLAPEATVAGVVVDARTGTPLANARVWTLPKLAPGVVSTFEALGYAMLEPALGVVTTDAGGRFTCGQLPGGERHLLCTAPGHGAVPPQLLQLEPGKAHAEVELSAPTLLTLRGASNLQQPPAGAIVRLRRQYDFLSSSDDDRDYGNCFPLAADGSFTATGIAPGYYLVQLLVDGGFRAGPPPKLVTDRVTIRQDDDNLRVMLKSGVPGAVRGKITGNVPPQRLGVVSVSFPLASDPRHTRLRYDGAATPVSRDGTYRMLEPPGTRTLVVFDLWTGAMLQHTAYLDVEPGSARTVDLTVQAAVVDVELGGPGRRDDVGYCLELRPEGGAWPKGIGGIDDMEANYSGMACRPAPGQHTARLYLPYGRFELRLYPQGQELQERRPGPSASAHIVTTVGASLPVTLRLPSGN